MKAEKYPFVKRLREEIYKATGWDIQPDDVLFPLLFCMQIMTRAVSAENRQADAAEWRKIAASLKEDLERTRRDYFFGAVLLALFFGLGIACGFFLGRF